MAVLVLEPNAHTASMPTHYTHTPAQGQMACVSLIRGTRTALVGTGSPEKNVDVILSQGELRGSEVPLGLKPGPK